MSPVSSCLAGCWLKSSHVMILWAGWALWPEWPGAKPTTATSLAVYSHSSTSVMLYLRAAPHSPGFTAVTVWWLPTECWCPLQAPLPVMGTPHTLLMPASVNICPKPLGHSRRAGQPGPHKQKLGPLSPSLKGMQMHGLVFFYLKVGALITCKDILLTGFANTPGWQPSPVCEVIFSCVTIPGNPAFPEGIMETCQIMAPTGPKAE